MPADTVSLPRRVVLDRAWQAAGLAESVLSGPDGAPLARTVKCLIDPLITRPKLNPELARPLLDGESAQRLTALIADHASLLWATDGWYGALKRARRARGIRTGNPQELYFPRAWELAHLHGQVTDHRSPERVVADTLDEIHPPHDLDPVRITAHLDAVRDDLTIQLAQGWTGAPGADPVPRAAAGISALVEDCGELEPELDDQTVSEVGQALKRRPAVLVGLAAALGVPAVALSVHDPVQPPPVTAPAITSRLGEALPLDRSLRTRILAAHRRAPGTGSLEEVVASEIDRARAPFGLHDPALRQTLLIGVVVAGQLRPLAATSTARGVAREIDARLRKEAYVLHARRLLAGGAPIHPAQQQVVDVLGSFAGAYLSRLWVRLHGFDVTDEVQDWHPLVTGVARSVSLDQRTRIRAALERAT